MPSSGCGFSWPDARRPSMDRLVGRALIAGSRPHVVGPHDRGGHRRRSSQVPGNVGLGHQRRRRISPQLLPRGTGDAAAGTPLPTPRSPAHSSARSAAAHRRVPFGVGGYERGGRTDRRDRGAGRVRGQATVARLCPLHTQLPQRLQLLGAEPVPPRFGVRHPCAELHGHRLGLVIDRDLFAVAAWGRPPALSFDPLCEGRQAPMKCLLRLGRAPSSQAWPPGRGMGPQRV